MSRFLALPVLLAIGMSLLAIVRLEPASTVSATGPDTWTPTGSMTDGRQFAAGSRLPDGRVLVTGGRTLADGFSSATTETYDPTSNVWAVAPSLGHARDEITQQITLANGRVLVVGEFIGLTAGDPTAAEIYDSSTSTWSSGGALAQPRPGCTATLLPSGKVLVAGGGSSDTNVWPLAVECTDPATNAWAAGAPMSDARRGHVAVLLSDGRVLITGGSKAGSLVASSEIYDPALNAWSAAAPMLQPRFGSSAVRLPDGRVLVAGGYDFSQYLSSAEFYDPSANLWTAAPPLAIARSGPRMVLLPSGLALMAGGFNPNFGYLKNTVLFNPTTNAWSTVAQMNIGRTAFVLVSLTDGRVLAATTEDSPNSAIAEVYQRDPIPPADTPTNTPTITPTPTNTPSPTPTTPPATPTPTPTPCGSCPTPTPTNTPHVTPTNTPQTLPDLVVDSISDRQSLGGCTTGGTADRGAEPDINSRGRFQPFRIGGARWIRDGGRTGDRREHICGRVFNSHGPTERRHIFGDRR